MIAKIRLMKVGPVMVVIMVEGIGSRAVNKKISSLKNVCTIHYNKHSVNSFTSSSCSLFLNIYLFDCTRP